MHKSSLRPAHFLLVATATALIGLTAGCTSDGASPAPTGASAPVAVPPAKAASATRTSRHPSEDVEFIGYDTKRDMPEFVKVVQQGNGGAHLVPDPDDPTTHELPMSPDASIRAVGDTDFPFETCPPYGCTTSLMIASVIGHYDNSFYAHIHVNAADQIDFVEQSAY